MTVVETELLLVEDVLPLPAAHAVTTRLAGMTDATETMTDVTATGTVIVSASANVTDLVALMNVTVIVTETSKMIVIDMRIANVVMMSATRPLTVTTEKVS